MHFVIVIYTSCKSLAKWWGLFLGTSHIDLEGWQNNPPVGFVNSGAAYSAEETINEIKLLSLSFK